MRKLDTLIGQKGRVMTKWGYMYWDTPDEVNEVIRIDSLDIPTLDGFRKKTVVIVKDSQGIEHDLAPSAIRGIQPV